MTSEPLKLTKIETIDDPNFDEEWYYLDEFGRRQGDYYSYYSGDGIYVEKEEKYTDGVLTYSKEDETNQLISYINYRDGILHGETRYEEPGFCDPPGGTYVDGVIQGKRYNEVEHYYPEPTYDYSTLKKYRDPFEKSYFDAKGLKQGKCIRFKDENGTIESECFFTDGVVDYIFKQGNDVKMFCNGERINSFKK